MQQKIQIAIADDHNLFIDGLTMLLKDEPAFEIICIANEGKELMELLHKYTPDIILLDINMPGMNGLDTVRMIKRHYPQLKVIMLSTYNEEHIIEKTKGDGADGYILKNANKDELVFSINKVHNGEKCFPEKMIAIRNTIDNDDRFLSRFGLTKREEELLQWLRAGNTNQQIADKLHLSIYTVETHRKNIMRKLKLKTPVELMKFLIENNI